MDRGTCRQNDNNITTIILFSYLLVATLVTLTGTGIVTSNNNSQSNNHNAYAFSKQNLTSCMSSSNNITIP